MTRRLTLDEFARRLGLRFADPRLLQEAMTHRSYVNEHDEDGLAHNERLEFLGDAVLGFITADLLFRRFPDMPEGDLTRLRSALVRTESLAELAVECRIGEVLRLGRGEEATGGRQRPNNLCDAFEALVGALYLDQGLEAVRDFVLPRLLPALDQSLQGPLDKDARSLLQEWSQRVHGVMPVYQTVAETGPAHEREFTVEVRVNDEVYGQGTGRTKQAAAMAAAQSALARVVPGD